MGNTNSTKSSYRANQQYHRPQVRTQGPIINTNFQGHNVQALPTQTRIIAKPVQPPPKPSIPNNWHGTPERADLVKKRHKIETARRIDEIVIGQNSKNNSYEKVFGKYLDSLIQEIIIEEPYTQIPYQMNNLVMFIELCVTRCPNLKIIKLITKQVSATEKKPGQIIGEDGLRDLQKNLRRHNIRFFVDFDQDSHDREIIFDNGIRMKLGRGLHYFEKLPERFGLGAFNYDFRACKATSIDVFTL